MAMKSGQFTSKFTITSKVVLRGTSCVCWRAVLLEDVSTGQSKFITVTKNSRIIVYKHYVTDDVINGKLVAGYFESLKKF